MSRRWPVDLEHSEEQVPRWCRPQLGDHQRLRSDPLCVICVPGRRGVPGEIMIRGPGGPVLGPVSRKSGTFVRTAMRSRVLADGGTDVIYDMRQIWKWTAHYHACWSGPRCRRRLPDFLLVRPFHRADLRGTLTPIGAGQCRSYLAPPQSRRSDVADAHPPGAPARRAADPADA